MEASEELENSYEATTEAAKKLDERKGEMQQDVLAHYFYKEQSFNRWRLRSGLFLRISLLKLFARTRPLSR